MYLSKGEYTKFSLKGRLNLLNEFGRLVKEKHGIGTGVKIYKLYDFYVEVISTDKKIIKAEPVLFSNLLSFY